MSVVHGRRTFEQSDVMLKYLIYDVKIYMLSWHLWKQVGVIAYTMYYRFPASQKDKYRHKIDKNNNSIINKFLSRSGK